MIMLMKYRVDSYIIMLIMVLVSLCFFCLFFVRQGVLIAILVKVCISLNFFIILLFVKIKLAE